MRETLKLKSIKLGRIVFIQCVGSKDKDRPYCSRICCFIALKNAILLKKAHPTSEVYMLHQGLQTYGREFEDCLRKAKEVGIRFIRYLREKPPELIDGKTVRVYHALLGRYEKIECDLIVLSTPLIQHVDAKDLSKLLKVPMGKERFFLEAHIKLRPVDFVTDGIYLCGTAQWPKDISESISQAYAAASHASALMTRGIFKAEAITSMVDASLCNGCRLCERLCPYKACKVKEGKSKVTEVLCKGCGVCGAACPNRAITMRHFKDDQIIAMIRSAFRGPPPTEVPHPKILAFLCNWCSYAGADMAGVSRMKYPDNVQAIRVMCSGRVDPVHVLEAFKNGADGVLVSGCHPGDCHYISGNYVAEKRVKLVRKVLEKIEIEPDRLYLGWISAAEGEKFARLITNLTKELKDKPLELTKEKIAKLEATIKALRVGKLKRIFGAMLPSDVKIDERYLPSIEKSIEAEIKRYGNLR